MRTETYERLRDLQEWNRLQEEARIANDLQRDPPGMARGEALRLAYNFMERFRSC
jgi:hypothetical protein